MTGLLPFIILSVGLCSSLLSFFFPGSLLFCGSGGGGDEDDDDGDGDLPS